MITMKRKFEECKDEKATVATATDGSKGGWVPGKIERVNGSILDSTANYIVHQCNCVTPHAAGLAQPLFEKFPWANDYRLRTPCANSSGKRDVAGTISVRGDGKKERFVINLFGQFYPGKPSAYESEEKRRRWFKDGLTAVSKLLSTPQQTTTTSPSSSSSSSGSLNTSSSGSLNSPPTTVAFPDGIGCTMAKGSWPKYLAMIETFAAENIHLRVLLLDYTKK